MMLLPVAEMTGISPCRPCIPIAEARDFETSTGACCVKSVYHLIR